MWKDLFVRVLIQSSTLARCSHRTPDIAGYGGNRMFRVMQLKARRNRRGFTLIELLVVVLILAVLMAVSIPLYLSAVADSQKKTCRANMQTIANAVQAARVKGQF